MSSYNIALGLQPDKVMKNRFDKNWLNEISLKNRTLFYKLSVIVGLFFVFPVFGFLLYAVKYDIIYDESLNIFLIAFLIFSFLGFLLLRSIFNKVVSISNTISEKITSNLSGVRSYNGEDELTNIIESFNAIEGKFKFTLEQLEKNALKMSTLKELTDLCYVTYDPEELMYITLERALKLANANIGSVLMQDE